MDNLDFTCTQCQSTNASQAQFCRACGYPREAAGEKRYAAPDAPVFCPECARKVRASDRFCLNCGHGLKTQHISEEGKFCYRCSRQLPDAARYCFGCGLAATLSEPDAASTTSAS